MRVRSLTYLTFLLLWVAATAPAGSMAVPAGSPGVAADPNAQAERVLVLFDLRTGSWTTAEAGADGLASCGGHAPDVVHCQTGARDVADFFIHGFASPFPEAATLESRIFHDNGVLYFRCNYVMGETHSCTVQGPQPPLSGTIFHECFAYVPFVALSPSALLPMTPGEPSGLAGGYGPWECLIA